MLKLGVIGTNIITDQMLDAAKATGKYESDKSFYNITNYTHISIIRRFHFC